MRRPGRAAVAREIRELVVRMATENERWGYTRIVGELAKVGHQVSRSTVRRILREHGVGPAPERLPHMPWSKFLKAHWEAIAAADFFTVEVWAAVGLVRYVVFFVLDLATRRVEIAGIAPAPAGFWMSQVARNGPDGPLGREAPSKGRGGVCRTLPSGAEPPGTRQPPDRGRAAVVFGAYRLPLETRWPLKSLRETGGLILGWILE